MSFSDHKITQFTHKIADLPDQPNLPADELKARFDSSPEELRQSVNGICDEGDALTDRVDQHDTQINQISMEKFPNDTIEERNLHHDLAAKLNAKAEQTALTAEAAARESADDALDTRMTAVETQKCEIYFGSYTGDGTQNRVISLGFTPKAVLLLTNTGMTYYDRHYYGGLAFDGSPVTVLINQTDYDVLKIVENGFQVTDYYYPNSYTGAESNSNGDTYFYLAFK